MIDDYRKWYKREEEFLNSLFNHDSMIYYRIQNVIITLNYIQILPEEEIIANDEYNVIFDAGYSYIFSVVSEVKLYLEKYFHNNLTNLLKYDRLINYDMYLTDLKKVLIDNDKFTESASKVFNDIEEEIENILINKKEVKDEAFDEYDILVQSTFSYSKDLITTPEVFDRIAEELQIC